jgi:rare lipoprotein A
MGRFARLTCLSLSLAALLLVGACGGRRKPPRPPVQTAPSPGEPTVSSELEGQASYYGEPHDGRPTANGEIFDKHAMTAAHRTMPFNTRVRVHNLENKRAVDVRINDRGPFIPGRIIDLSEAAGRQLGLVGPGVAWVRLEILSSPVEQGVTYAVQVGAFSDRRNAEQLQRRLASRYASVTVTPHKSEVGLVFRVRVGSESSLVRAQELQRRLQKENLGAMVVRRDDE